MGDLNFDLYRSIKVKSDGVIGLPIYDFLLKVYSNIGPNLAPLRDISLSNLSDLDLTFQGHLRSIVMISLDSPHGFLLMVNTGSNIGPNLAPL